MNQQFALEVSNLSVAYKKDPVLWDVSFRIPTGTLLAVVGPNGAGKSTLIKSILGLTETIAGTVSVFGQPYKKNKKQIAYVSQRAEIDWDFPTTVLDVALMGRFGHLGWFRRPGKKDYALAREALEQVGMLSFQDRPIGQLSGGQQQRVFLARAIVQDADLYFMDEPFVGVDIATEKTIISFLKQLRDSGKTIIVVHHDLETLREYFDWVLLLNVNVVACGPVSQVLVPQYICAAYGERDVLGQKGSLR